LPWWNQKEGNVIIMKLAKANPNKWRNVIESYKELLKMKNIPSP
jgi:hypothetical protein